MNYNSWAFWCLFAAVLLPYWRLAHRHQNTLLLLASYAFYSFWDYRFVFLILLSTAIDFVGGLAIAGETHPPGQRRRIAILIVAASLVLCTGVDYTALLTAATGGGALAGALPESVFDFAVPAATVVGLYLFNAYVGYVDRQAPEQRRRLYMVASIAANLTILGCFKYANFFSDSFVTLLGRLGFDQPSWLTLNVLLPAGISFYTFQSMSYCIDVYRGHVRPTADFRDFALFVCFFPHLVAGPIMRASTLLPQVVLPRRLAAGAWAEGTYLVALGMFKKLVVADNVAPIVNAVYTQAETQPQSLSGVEVVVATYAFALQIYCDFSGYSNVARGISKWLGFDLALNFVNPYLAQSPTDFWLRWHISLSSWLRDYLYIPLGGNRQGTLKTYRNLTLTMILGGLWHGANWTFVAWGLYHGVILCVYRLLGISSNVRRESRFYAWRLGLRLMVMVHLTCVGWLFFRADSMAGAFEMLGRVFTAFDPSAFAGSSFVYLLFFGVPLLTFEFWLGSEVNAPRFLAESWWKQWFFWAYIALMIVVFQAARTSEFIYFQF